MYRGVMLGYSGGVDNIGMGNTLYSRWEYVSCDVEPY